MKIKFALSLALLIILACSHLVYRYARFYNTIGKINLQSPYKQTTFSLENPKKEGSAKYVALGDSLTAGVGSKKVKTTFVYQVAENLSGQFGRVEVVNLGRPGSTSADLIVDQLTVAVSEKPDYVTLLIGINDIHNKVGVAEYKTRMVLILDELLTKTSAQIVLINLPYLGDYTAIPFPLDKLLDLRTKQFNKVIEEYKGRDRIRLVDLYGSSGPSFSYRPEFYASDHFHPSDEGYLFWGMVINAN